MAIYTDVDKLNYNFNGGTEVIGYHTDEDFTPTDIIAMSGMFAASWIHPSYTLQTFRTGTITIDVDPNSGEERSGYVIYTGKEGTLPPLQNVFVIINITQAKGTLSGEVTIYKIAIDDIQTETATLDYNEHKLAISLRASSTIAHIETAISQSWLSFYTASEYVDVDPNYNIWTFVYDVQTNSSPSSRNAQILYDVTDTYGVKVINYLDVDVEQGYEEEPKITVDDIYTSSDAKTLLAIIRTYLAQISSYTSNDSWITNLTLDDHSLVFDIEANRTYTPRIGSITVSGFYELDPSVTLQYTFYIHQAQSAIKEILPIWKDYLIPATLSTEDVSDVYYNVLVNDNVIFSGHAYANNDETPQINVTEIVRDYLIDTTQFPRRPLIFNINNYITVDVLSGDQASNITTPVATINYYYDYSFEDNNKRIRNIPVINEVDPRQMITLSLLNFSGEQNTLQVRDGMHVYNSTLIKPGIHQFIDETHGGEYINVEFAGEKLNFTVRHSCSKYCLYYLNTLGGWDTLIFDGHNVESEQYDPKLKTNDYINTTTQFEKQHYLKNIKQTYKLITRHLTDDESRRMINVLRSPKAFLQDLETEQFFPVLINNKATDIKTFKNQGRKLYTYTIEVEASQQKFIKN